MVKEAEEKGDDRDGDKWGRSKRRPGEWNCEARCCLAHERDKRDAESVFVVLCLDALCRITLVV